jgi:hypothetical protein
MIQMKATSHRIVDQEEDANGDGAGATILIIKP